MGTLAPLPCQITPNFLHPLALPATCLAVRNSDSLYKAEVGSDSKSRPEREPNVVCPLPSNFQDMSHNPSLRVAYRHLVPMARLFSTWLLISDGDQRCLTNFIQGKDISIYLHPDHDNFKRTEEGASSKNNNCLAEGCGSHFTNKESACSHIQAVHSHTGLFCPWIRLDCCHLHPDYFQNWKAFRKHLSSVHGACLEMSFRCEELEAE